MEIFLFSVTPVRNYDVEVVATYDTYTRNQTGIPIKDEPITVTFKNRYLQKTEFVEDDLFPDGDVELHSTNVRVFIHAHVIPFTTKTIEVSNYSYIGDFEKKKETLYFKNYTSEFPVLIRKLDR
jgi:hypothetical protein